MENSSRATLRDCRIRGEQVLCGRLGDTEDAEREEPSVSVPCATLHGMAICMACDLEMLDSVGCTWRPSRIPNGRSACHDCGTPPRALHHPGCDGERCRCGQMLSCGSGCAVDECEREDGHDYIDAQCRWCNEPFGQLRVVDDR